MSFKSPKHKNVLKRYALILALPGAIYLASFTLYPIINNIILSFHEEDIYGNFHWVGVGNYLWFEVDPYFAHIVRNTLFYATMVPVIDVLIALPIAVALKRVGGAWLTVLMIPAFIPWVTAATAWYLFLNPNYGIGYYLSSLGVIKTNPLQSIWTVLLITVWETFPTAVLIIYSGLRSIPKTIEEAAYADGLTGIRKFLSVDIPLIMPQILTAFVLTMLNGFFIFDPIYIGTSQAGPRILDNLIYYAYQKFWNGEMGYAASLIAVMTAISTILSFAYLKLMTSRRAARIRAPAFIPSVQMPKIIHVVILALATLFVLTPFTWLVIVSLKPPSEVIKVPPTIIPERITFDNFLCAVGPSCSYVGMPSGGLPFLITSIAIASINTAVTIILASMLAYAASMHGIGGTRLILFILYLIGTPSIIYIIPLYLVLRTLGLLNTWWGLLLVYPIMTLPYNTWILYNYFKTFPKTVEEAAMSDGMSLFKTFFRVVLPLSRNGLSVAAVYAFLFSWSALVFPLAFTSTPLDLSNPWRFSGAQTYSVYIAMLVAPTTMSYGIMASAGIVSIIPPLTLLLLARRNLEKLWGAR